MAMIWESITYLYAYLAVIPIIPFIIVLFGYGAFIRDRKKAFRLAMDITTAFLIGCVAVLFDNLFGSKFGFYGILLFMLLGAGLLGNAQFRTRGSIDAKKIFRTVWRLSFFTMSLLYVVFMCIGFGKMLFTGAA
ncbi:DUF3397 domain-containing protein [Paenibacillus alkaliterrae]|uniref:DUF3397 domain-containing protein n=1 Tax=Paenibacillus alkaliterrae TaxID=320909 RepID=UPI001F487163|nr:DUF3397 domain-containing protein [Paenibacillus alkaliterrae]MCF2939329.1 DUF3397 domain-containing protein [Paenibacillus alkaliterrae]